MQKKPRDVVVVRVSEQGDREEENFHSPKAQLAKAKLWSKDQGNRVVDAVEEIDVSGKLPLAKRPGLLSLGRSRWCRPARPITSWLRTSTGWCAH
jgi:hypothetical protein